MQVGGRVYLIFRSNKSESMTNELIFGCSPTQKVGSSKFIIEQRGMGPVQKLVQKTHMNYIETQDSLLGAMKASPDLTLWMTMQESPPTYCVYIPTISGFERKTGIVTDVGMTLQNSMNLHLT